MISTPHLMFMSTPHATPQWRLGQAAPQSAARRRAGVRSGGGLERRRLPGARLHVLFLRQLLSNWLALAVLVLLPATVVPATVTIIQQPVDQLNTDSSFTELVITVAAVLMSATPFALWHITKEGGELGRLCKDPICLST